jgi:hypothetical protein
MKNISTLLFVMLFTSSFAQTQEPQKPTQTTKPKTTSKTSSKKQSTKPKAATTTHTVAPTTTHTVAPTPQSVKPAPKPVPVTTPTPAPKPVPQSTPQPISQPQQVHTSQSKIEEVWVGGSVGGGLALSTNIVGSGAVFPANLELLFQTRHHRCGIGLANELYITPESLYHLALGEAPVVSKLYFSYEAFIFRNFPINLGFSSHVGFFGTSGNHTLSQKSGTVDTTTARGGMFGNVGAVLELGARPFYFFIRPSIEYKSWSGFHKEIMATVSLGIRLKFLTQYELERRADKKHDRYHKY